MRKTLKSSNPFFIPEDITLGDDAFHRSKGRFHAEWWYFDAVFDNGYSINAILMVISRRNYGIAIPILTIYKDLKLKFNRRELYCFNEFVASENIPHVKLSKKNTVTGYIDENTNNWVYDVSMEVGGQKIDLHFTGLMKGWKGETPVSKWGVILPKATVKGSITLNGEQINVNGTGYHDHNWELSLPIMQRGWYWGRVEGDLLNLVWSKIMLTKSKDFLLAVLNDDVSDYVNIKPEKIRLLDTYSAYDHREEIPDGFVLQVESEDESTYVDVKMKTIEAVHHVKTPILNYWRYHVKVAGHMSYGKRSEEIDRVGIIEFLKIR